MQYFPVITLLLLVIPAAAVDADIGGTVPEYSRSYDPARDPFADGRSAIEYAQKSRRRILIELGGNWCSYCLRLDRFITATPEVQDLMYRKFVVLKVNVSDENDNRAFRQGLPLTHGYPHIFVADSQGNILHSKDTTQLLVNGEYSRARFIEFLQRWGTPEDL